MSAGDDARTGGRNADAFDHNNDDSHRHARSQQWATRRGGIAQGTEASDGIRGLAAVRGGAIFAKPLVAYAIRRQNKIGVMY
jgi:hypothetical protein